MWDQVASLSVGEVFAAVGTIVAAAFGAWLFIRKVWPVLKSIPGGVVAFARGILTAAEWMEAVRGLPAFIERTDARISEIHHEVHFNNGSSVKDSAIRTERAVGELTETAGRLEVGVAGLYKRVDELAAVDDRLWATVDPDDEESDG